MRDSQHMVIKTLKNGMAVVPLPEKPDSMPKKAPVAYQIFVKEKKEENVALSEMEARWKKLEAEGQKKYKDQAVELAKQAEEDMNAFKVSDAGKAYNLKGSAVLANPKE